MRTKLNDDEFDEVMKKLFEAVGRKFVSIKRSCKEKDWYMKSAWTLERENEFEMWLKKYLQTKLRMPAQMALEYAKWFCFDYGWKYKCT